MALERRTFLKSSFALAAAASAGPVMDAEAATPRKWRRIAVEEHFVTPEILVENAKLAAKNKSPAMPSRGNFRHEFETLELDIGDGRVAALDRDGVGMQLLSQSSPGVQAFDDAQLAVDLAKLTNERLAQSVRAHPTRFGALTTMATQRPKDAAMELERCVKTYGFNGAMINSHTEGEFLDNQKYWPMLEAAVALDVPIYLHPRELAPAMAGVGVPYFHVGWGYQVDVGTHILRMIAAGVFDQFPSLTVVIGHMGEGLPAIVERLDGRADFEQKLTQMTPKFKHPPSYYIKNNLYITTSGLNHWRHVKATIDVVGIDRMIFALDYPLETNGPSVQRMDAAPLKVADREKFYHGNAERVFKIKAQAPALAAPSGKQDEAASPSIFY